MSVSVICYFLAVSFITLQYEICLEVKYVTGQYVPFLVVPFITAQYELFLASFITVQYELLLAASFVVLCIGSIICYCAICAVLAVSFVTVQYEVCHEVSVVTECELCLTVICYILFLAVPFVTVQYELFIVVSSNLAISGSVNYYCAICAISGSVCCNTGQFPISVSAICYGAV